MKKITLAIELTDPQVMPTAEILSRSSGAPEKFCREISALGAKAIKVKFLGRPKKFDRSDEVQKLLSNGKSIRAIATELKISTATVQAIKKILPQNKNYRK